MHVQLANWKAQLDPLGKMIRVTKPDGNCLFRAFAMTFAGTDDDHLEFREQAVGYMLQNSEDFMGFMAPNTRPSFRWASALSVIAAPAGYGKDTIR